MVIETVFWIAVAGVVYPYLAYPAIMFAWGRLFGRPPVVADDDASVPSVSLIIPVHNGAAHLPAKIANTAALDYPADRIEVLVVSDGSTDDTVPILRRMAPAGWSVVELPERAGKAAALNAGLASAANEIVVFSDASIELASDALRRIVRGFADPEVGCISGEDRIEGFGGEALYGRYELLLRRLESQVHSIVGASGSFYAQRRAVSSPFQPGLAPDFLSVLLTVRQGSRAISDGSAVGWMTSVKAPSQEFERKVRTLIRGLTTLFAYPRLLDPTRHGAFAFALWSHKVMRWTAPAFLLLALIAAGGLVASPFYAFAFAVQVAFYLTAAAALLGWDALGRSLPGKVAVYFAVTNTAVFLAWWRYLRGDRLEVWTPSRR